MTHHTEAERAELCAIVQKHLTAWTKEMEGYCYFSSNPGVSQDDYEEIAAEIAADIQAARRAPAAPVPQVWRELAERCLSAMEQAVHFRKTGEGRPPEQTCLFEIQDLRAALAAAPQPPEAEAKVSRPHFEAAPVQMPELTNKQIEAAAKCIAESLDYPWHGMVESGRESMRKIAKTAIERANGIKGEIN